HEHLAILRLLGVDRGVVAITKADAVDAETLALAVEEARELVPGVEVVVVSAKTGAGIDELREALARAAHNAAPERDAGPARLFVRSEERRVGKECRSRGARGLERETSA